MELAFILFILFGWPLLAIGLFAFLGARLDG
jgi:hypothetical protein